MKNIDIKKYDNGAKLICQEIEGASYVAFAIHVSVGAGDECESELGLAHFLEHLFFKSTKEMSTQELATSLESLGARINAQTNDVKTVYHFHCLKENFERCVEIYSQMFSQGLFNDEEIAKEKSVVLEEIKRAKDSPLHVAYMNAFRELMGGTRFGHDVLGLPEVISNVIREEILSFKERNYTPNRIIFSVCGNISFNETKEVVEKYFKNTLNEKFEKRPSALPVVIKPKKNYILETQDRNQAQIYILFKSIAANDPSRFSVHLFQDILGGGLSSRLFTELREKRGLVYSTWAECYSCLEFGILGIYAGTSPNNVGLALENIKAVLKELSENGVTEQELIKAKNNLKSSKVYAQDSKMQIAKLNAAKFAIFGEIPSLDWEFEMIEKVTIEDVNKVAKQLYSEKDFVVSVVGKDIEERELRKF